MAASRERPSFDLSWRVIAKVLAAMVLVWIWMQIWHVFMVLLAAIIIAVALDPVVRKLEQRGVPRGAAALVVVLALVGLIAAMTAASWATLQEQSRLIAERITALADDIRRSFPIVEQIVPNAAGGGSGLTEYALGLARSVSTALGMIVLALALTVYLLIEWKATREWLVAFVPGRARPRVNQTLDEARDVVYRYVVGNLIAAGITAAATWLALWLMGVPASLVLALLSGVLNFIPIIGFIASSVIAAAVAAAVSPNVLLLVIAFYLVFNVVEGYLIQPKVFGRELALSDLAVLLAVLVGAELGGVMGALLALPVAAIYPTVERIWLRERLSRDTVEIHQRRLA